MPQITIKHKLYSQLSGAPTGRLAIRCLLDLACGAYLYAGRTYPALPRFSTVSIPSSRVSKVRPRKAYWKPGKCPAAKPLGQYVLKPQRINATCVTGPANWNMQTAHRHLRTAFLPSKISSDL